MSLNKKTLEDQIRAIPPTSIPPPTANAKASVDFASAIATYYRDALAGPASVTFSPIVLAGILKKTLDSNVFLQTLGTSIQAWSTTWSWSGGGFLGAPGTTVVLGPNLNTLMASFVAKSSASKVDPPKDNITEMVSIIDSWSKTIVVNLVNSAGAVVPTPVT